MTSPSWKAGLKISGSRIFLIEATIFLLLAAALVETVNLITSSANLVQPNAVWLINNTRLLLLVLLELTVFVCFSSRIYTCWQELLKREEDPPDLSSHGVRILFYQHMASSAEWITTYAKILSREFSRPYTFQRIHTRNVAYFLYAKKGWLSLLAANMFHAGIFIILLSLILASLGSQIPYTLPLLLSLCGLCLFVPGFLVHMFFPYHKLWIRCAEVEGITYATIIFYAKTHITGSNRWSSRLQDSFEKAHRGIIEKHAVGQGHHKGFS
jgi:hypothetical protein